jgi:molybdopterin-guanine dinucleotide biosynthesis protein A
VYDLAVEDLAAFVLAGGQSTRMGKGKDKAFLELAGRTLLVRALELAASVSRKVYIVGESAKVAAFGKVVEDIYRQRGPLGGIHAALARSTKDLNLMLAVDLPFIEPAFLSYLVSQSREQGAMVTVPQAQGRWQPLCAVYRREFGAIAEQSLREGRNKIDALFLSSLTWAVSEEEMLRNGFSPQMFRNLNTPEELQAAKDQIGKSI